MSKMTERPEDYIKRMCSQFAEKVWNEALDRAAEEAQRADNYRDAVCRILEMKIDRLGA